MDKEMNNGGGTQNTIIAMVMLNNEAPFNYEAFAKDIAANTQHTVINDSVAGSNSTVLTVDGETVMILYIPLPVPAGDIEGTARYAYNWMTAEKDLETHKAHIIVSVLNSLGDAVQRFTILTAVICSILRTNNAAGVYMGEQSLLIPAKHYLSETKKRTGKNQLPLNLWIYFGLRTVSEKYAGYTYGLKAFDKKEMEITPSNKGLVEIREFLYNIAHYLVESDTTFKDGQTCGLSEEDVVTITLTKGEFNEGEVFRLGF